VAAGPPISERRQRGPCVSGRECARGFVRCWAGPRRGLATSGKEGQRGGRLDQTREKGSAQLGTWEEKGESRLVGPAADSQRREEGIKKFLFLFIKLF
jgi:hypothetical protein